ncbi:hypothetical protein EJ08DRAFT_332591 [Tothia fuscella]|uniref:18S rRNA factor 2 n=1 Tax=Tothia fuscella TaxID=1048955 RepID=A0A9P4NN29_9PEZI|nr:hypothetical protein EJ08DRAFT_332591 [Tothia fuscella]
MATRRKNEWLEADESEKDDTGYDSELAESRQKSIVSRSVKRRKVVDQSDSDSGSDHSSDGEQIFEDAKETVSPLHTDPIKQVEFGESTLEPKSPVSITSDDKLTPKPSDSKSALSKKLAKSMAKTQKTGVIYLSRIPPFMKPHTLKTLLTPYAPTGLGRIFLTPEDPLTHKSRVRNGGNKKRNFSDGWVEFLSKREAKIAVDTLNTGIIGGKKGGYYHDDVWNLKYLRGFKWRHLTEQIANENAERAARLRAEGMKERREVREYLGNVERAKMLDGMERKKKERREKVGDVGVEGKEDGSVGIGAGRAERRSEKRQFRQTEVLSKSKRDLGGEQPEEVKRVLSKIF